MGKSRLALLLLFSFTLNIDTGFALRCYGCADIAYDKDSSNTFPKDPPKCSDDGFGKEFDCPSGSEWCAKNVLNGKSICFFKNYTYILLELTHFNLALRFCNKGASKAGCETDGSTEVCACDSDLCNTSAKPNVSMAISRMIHFLTISKIHHITTSLLGFCLFNCDFGIVTFINFTFHNVLNVNIRNKCMISYF